MKCVIPYSGSGVKGPSCLSTIPQFDIVRGMSFDYMHCILLGVALLLLQLWFNTQHHKELWFLGAYVDNIDDLFRSIAPPDEIKRTPRSLQATLKFWKGTVIK